MSGKIFKSAFFTSMIVLAISFLLVFNVLFNYFENQMFSELQNEADYLAYITTYISKNDINTASSEANIDNNIYNNIDNNFKNIFKELKNDSKRISLISPTGAVIADTEAESDNLENHSDRKEIIEAQKNGSGKSVRYSGTLTEKTLYYAKKLENGNILRISTTQTSVIVILLGFMQPIIIIIVIALCLSLLLSYRVSNSIIKPINALDLENPENNQADKTYEELTPLLKKITQQKKTINRQIKEAEKREQMRREFTSNVSHEFKTPLTSISGFAEMMKSSELPSETIKDFSGSIYDEAQRMISLVSDIMKISELDEGAVAVQKEKVDLYSLSKDTANRLKPIAEKQNIKINVINKIPKNNTPYVFGAKKILDEMIFNLCDNAIKYNVPNGKIDIITESFQENFSDKIKVTVKDTGIGIPKSEQARVFERFYRVDKSRSKSAGGTGLGLAIVKHGAMYHDADLSLSSTEGVGTSISLTFDAL